MAHSEGKWQRLGDGSLLTEDAAEGLGHIVPLKTYWKVYISLLVLTVVTVWAAAQDFGVFSLTIALAIATLKAGIVTLIFMHLKFENKLIWAIVIYPLFILALLIAGTLGDQSVKVLTKPAVSIVDYNVPVIIKGPSAHNEHGSSHAPKAEGMHLKADSHTEQH